MSTRLELKYSYIVVVFSSIAVSDKTSKSSVNDF